MAFFNPPDRVAIKSIITTTPPGSPNTVDIYVVPPSATGAWSGQTDKFAKYNGTSWDFILPNANALVWTEDNNTLYTYNSGAWAVTNANASGATLPVADTTAIVKGSADNTKQLRFEVDGFTSGQTRVATPPNEDFTMVGAASAQTLTNKVINASNNTLSNIPESALSITDNTTGNASTSAHGFVPKRGGDSTKYYSDDGTYSIPAGTSLTVEEVDGTPSVTGVTEIIVSNGTLTDNGGGSVTITTGGGGGGGAPTGAKYVVTEADGTLTDEIVIPTFASHADIVPASPHSKDDEFNAGSLDGKWSWLNQGTSSIAFNSPNGWATITPQSSTSWRGIVQAVPSGSWTATAKLSAGYGHLTDGYTGLWLHGGTDGTGDVWCMGKDGAPGTTATRCEQISSYGFSGTRSNNNTTWGVNTGYMRMVWNGTTIQCYISLDGIRYQAFTAFTPSYTPTKFGVATRSSSGFASSFDWFRVA